MNPTREIWKVRSVKSYAEAHNHLLVGRLVEANDAFVRLHCRSFHFTQTANAPRDIRTGAVQTRILPWSRIEIVNVLPEGFDFQAAKLQLAPEGMIVLSDGKISCRICGSGDRKY